MFLHAIKKEWRDGREEVRLGEYTVRMVEASALWSQTSRKRQNTVEYSHNPVFYEIFFRNVSIFLKTPVNKSE